MTRLVNTWMRFVLGFERKFDAVAQRYSRGLALALRMRPAVVAMAIALLVLSVSVLPLHLLSIEYTPQEDDGQFEVNLTMPVGSSLQKTDEAARMLETAVQAIPEVRSIYARIGSGGGPGGSSNTANFTVEAVEKSKRSKSLEQVMGQVRAAGALVPELRVQTSVANPLSGGRNFISIDILGDDFTQLSEVAGQVVTVAEQTPGISNAQSSFQQQAAELRFTIDRERAAAAGVTTQNIANTLRMLVQGVVVTQLRPDGEPAVDILVTSQDGLSTSSTALGSMPVAGSKSGLVALSQVTKPRPARAPVQITRVDRKRSVQVSAAVTDRPVGDVARDLRASLAALTLPTGYRYEVRGTVQQLDSAMGALSAALALSVLLIYMTLVALYESLLIPLAIMFSLPVSVVGAFGGLILTGNTLNIFSMIGMIALMGLSAKNAILLVDYANTLRKRGTARNEALLEAGRTRLRPIVMTSATVIAAMTPLVVKLEAGAESRAPMAAVIIGGVFSSTLLTLFVVPVVYTLLDDLQTRFHVRTEFRWPWHRTQPATGAGVAAAPTASPSLGAAAAQSGPLSAVAEPAEPGG